MSFPRDVVIVGGCGRVGLPLGLALADSGLAVTLYDRDAFAVDRVLLDNHELDPIAQPHARELGPRPFPPVLATG